MFSELELRRSPVTREMKEPPGSAPPLAKSCRPRVAFGEAEVKFNSDPVNPIEPVQRGGSVKRDGESKEAKPDPEVVRALQSCREVQQAIGFTGATSIARGWFLQ